MKSPSFILMYLALVTMPQQVLACPFCSATQQTISEEIAAAEICVIANLVQAAAAADDATQFGPAADDTGMARFAVQEVLRGEPQAADLGEIELVYFGTADPEKSFLINALSFESLAPGKETVLRVDWATPLPLSSRGVEYVKQLEKLPAKGAERLAFFQQYLEDEDPLLAQDAYDEFARAAYSEVISLGNQMDREQLISWIETPQVGPTRRRLYLTMLGVCGQAADAMHLESLLLYDYQLVKPGIATLLTTMAHTGPAIGVSVVDELIRADVRRKQQCLDALIAAYLKLRGPDGLALIEKKFLDNPNAEYSHIYAALMALRFHGEETDVLPKERLLVSMRLLLDNEEIADQVVADLARWEDWSVLDRLVSMFQSAEKDGWIRQPVVSYLLTAAEQPGDVGAGANAALRALEEIDPECVKRTRKYMSFGLFARAVTKSTDPPESPPKESAADESPPAVAADEDPLTVDEETSAPAEPAVAATSAAAVETDPAPPQTTPLAKATPPSRLMLIGIPILAGVLLIGIFALLLRGADVRSGSHDGGVEEK